MATNGPGGLVERRRTQVGPAPWWLWTRVLRAQGWVWWLLEEEDTDPGAGAAYPFSFRDGWLTLSAGVSGPGPASRTLGDPHAAGLAAHLAAAGGREVWWRDERAELRPRPGELAAAITVRDRRFGHAGRPDAEHESAVEEVYDLESGGVNEESADAAAAASWDEVPRPGPVAGPPDHPELAPRRGWMRPTREPDAVVSGPSVVLSGVGWTVALDPAGRSHLEAALRRAGVLEEGGAPPDLARWRERAARRVGLAEVPPPDSPDHRRWLETWRELTRADRSAPARPGRVSGWKLVHPGTWELSPAETATVGACAGIPGPLRDGAEQPWEVRVADDAQPPAEPWTLTPPSGRS